MEIDPNVCLENLRQNKIMSEREVRILCQLCKEIFFEESNVHVNLFD